MSHSASLPERVEPSELSALRHDLRTLIGHVLGYGEMVALKLKEREQDDLLADMEKVRIAAQRMLSMLAERMNATTLNVNGRAAESELSEPVPHPASRRPTPPALTRLRVPADQSGRLLVVDDNDENRDLLSRMLEQQGHKVTTESGGAAALRRLELDDFDVVLLDIMMPDVDGRDVLAGIKSTPKTEHIPVIMISALEEMRTVVECIEMGAADYLPKPFNPVLLQARVTAGLRAKRARDRELQTTAELQESYRRLQKAEQMRDDLTHMIVHDLRTPLSSFLSGLQTLPLLGKLNEPQKEIVQIATYGGEKLLGMIADMLTVEKAESGVMPLDYKALFAVDLIDQAAGNVSMLVENESLTLHRDVPARLPGFEGDEDKLVRTLVNLLGNAIKFTPEGGTVTVAAGKSEDGRSLTFSVTDTGNGIPADSLDHIFEKFGQVESQRQGNTRSTGLGLTFCKMAVEAHGGQISVASIPGNGSTFSFAIPIVKPSAVP